MKQEIVCRVISEKDGGMYCGLPESNMKSLTDFITQEINEVNKGLFDFCSKEDFERKNLELSIEDKELLEKITKESFSIHYVDLSGLYPETIIRKCPMCDSDTPGIDLARRMIEDSQTY